MPRHNEKFTDEQVLEILHLNKVEGVSTTVIGRQFGVSRNSILGLIHRIKHAENVGDGAPHNDDKVKRPENRDGGMPAEWWRR